MNIIQMSASASILIVVTVIIRAVALHKLPHRTFLALWGIAALRLVVPFHIPFKFNFYTALNLLQSQSVQDMNVHILGGETALSANKEISYLSKAEEMVLTEYSDSAVQTIVIIWLLGMLICALFFLVTYVRCHREFSASLPVESGAAAWRPFPLRRQVQIRQTDRIDIPLTYGVFRPVILFPKEVDWKDDKSRYALTHEYVHIRYWDALAKFMFAMTVCIHWFNPLVWFMYFMANRDIELSCDEAVVKILGVNSKADYALTLIAFAEVKEQRFPIANYFCRSAIEERIFSIMKMKIRKTSFHAVVIAILLVISVGVAFVTSALDENEALLKEGTGAQGKYLDYLKTLFADLEIDIRTISESDNSIVEEMDDEHYEAFDVHDKDGREYLLLLRKEDKSFEALLDDANNVLYGLVDNGMLPKYFITD
ncbi:MAG: M56 family metallopeptidase [bacterium]|nr:M56 family metallopeptidase [bacterium]